MARFNRLTVNVVLVAIAATAGCVEIADPSASSSSSTGAQAGALRDPDVKANVRAAVLPHASSAGIPSPATMLGVAASDHQAAEDVVSGSIINDHSPVYVVQLTGGPFTVRHRRPGVGAHQSDVMIVTIDSATYRVTDIGYPTVGLDLSRIDADVVDLLAP